MPRVTFRCSQELFSQLKIRSENTGVNLSDTVRTVIEQLFSDKHPSADPHNNGETLTVIQNQLSLFQSQLAEKDQQISQLHQLVALAQTNANELTKQLEDVRQRRWWQFWQAN